MLACYERIDPDYEPEWANPELDRAKERIENAASFLDGVLKQLYGKEAFNVETLERYLNELAGYLDFDPVIMNKELAIVRKA